MWDAELGSPFYAQLWQSEAIEEQAAQSAN